MELEHEHVKWFDLFAFVFTYWSYYYTVLIFSMVSFPYFSCLADVVTGPFATWNAVTSHFLHTLVFLLKCASYLQMFCGRFCLILYHHHIEVQPFVIYTMLEVHYLGNTWYWRMGILTETQNLTFLCWLDSLYFLFSLCLFWLFLFSEL